jgi:hypothetical protein
LLVQPAAIQIAGPGLVWRPWIPGISLASGQYSTEQSPVVSNGDPSAVMHYGASRFKGSDNTYDRTLEMARILS